MSKLPSHVKISEDALMQQLGDEVMILNLASEHYYKLDEVGGRLLQLFSEHSSVQKVFDIMMHEYEVPADLLREDMILLIEQLLKAKLISVN
ncbi:MAG: coenzyme biosynthesis protein PqqD [Mucilaginibacter sp.]|nr:coenzyme biosynthesis protein PqqD [Mucilaginibacter sp.]